MPARDHNRAHFFKYTSYETALRSIESKTFRWSSPLNFNDPFDHQAGFELDVDPVKFANLLTASIERIVFSHDEPSVQPESIFAALTFQLRTIRDRLPREEFVKDMQEASMESAVNLRAHIDNFNKAIQAELCHSRVFCVSEHNANVVMWSHYAEEHRGVVFKLRCVDEIDNALLAARQVRYAKSFVPFLSAEKYAAHLTGEQPVDLAQLCWNIAFTKHSDWAYEKEWRVHIAMLNEPAGDGYSIYSEDERVFEAIYLGCRMTNDALENLVELTRKSLPETKIFRASKSTRKFSLTFTEIS